MKRTIEILLRLVAPPARLVALLFAVCAASGARATDSLEETGGFVTDSSLLAFKGVTLAELTTETLGGRFGGGWSGSAKGLAMTFNNFDRSGESEGSITCQAQIDNGDSTSNLRGVFLTFTQSGSDVYVQRTDARYKTSSLGDALTTSDNQAISGGALQYSVFNLRLPRTYVSDATVVWNIGEFGMTKVGADGNEYAIALPDSGISISESGDNIGSLVVASSGATTGATIDVSGANTQVASVLVKYSSLAAASGSKVTLATAQATYNANNALVVVGPRTTANGALTMTGYWDTTSENTYAFGTVPTLSAGSGYFQYSYKNDISGNGGTYAYAGKSALTLAGGGNTSLRWTNDGYRIKKVSVGGPITTSSGVVAWPDVVIESVALFIGNKYSADHIADFEFAPDAETTITTDGTYTLTGLFTATATDGEYVINVEESATLNMDSATTVNMITFNVAEGKTLTLTGSTLTATGGIVVRGEGTVSTAVAAQLAGALKGSGTLTYSGVKPTGLNYSKALWTGTLCIENLTGSANPIVFSDYANSGSTVRLSGVQMYVNKSNATDTFNGTLEIGPGGLEINNGNGNGHAVVARLTGTGVLKISGGSANGNALIIKDSSDFEGTLNIATSTKYVVTFGDSGSGGATGKAIINSGKTATVPTGKTWNANGGWTVNGIFAFSGTGKATGAVATASGATLDFSAYTGEVPAVSGALTLASGTTIKLPAGTTFPYQIAGSGDATVENVTYQIGDATAVTRTVLLSGGYLYPERRATFAGGETAINWSALSWDITYADEASAVSRITATASGTLALGTVSTGKVILEVPQGVELTLTGTLAASEIVVTGAGTVVCSAANTLQGTVTGDATVTVVYSALPTTGTGGATFTDAGWQGVLWLKSATIAAFKANLGNANSVIRFTGCSGYPFYGDTTTKVYEIDSTIDLQDDGDTKAFTTSDGYGGYRAIFKALTGTGTFVGMDRAQYYIFKDASEFEGTISLPDSATTHIVFGTGDALTTDTASGSVYVGSGAKATVATGKTWTAPGGIDVKGILAIVGTGLVSGDVTASSGATLDFSDATADTRISGALTTTSGVSIKLPTGATLPYRVASSGSGAISSYTIGEGTAEYGALLKDGQLVATRIATISSNDAVVNFGDISWSGTGDDYTLVLQGNATYLTFGDASVDSLKIVVQNNGELYVKDDLPENSSVDGISALAIAASGTETFIAGYTRLYSQIGTTTTGNGAINTAGNITVFSADGQALTSGNYTLARWLTPQKLSTGYGYISAAPTITYGVAAGLSFELVYMADRIALRVYDASVTPAADGTETLKVWPYGDSITEGFNGGGTKANYRVLLAQKLTLLGYNVEMVGCYGQINQANGVDPSGQVIPDAWKWHSAKHGGTAGPTSATGRNNLQENVDTLAAQAGSPDVVLLHIGVNDLAASGQTPASTFTAWTNVVDRLSTDLPDSKIVATTLIYGDVSYSTRASQAPNITTFNGLVREFMTNSKPAAWTNVIFLDMETKVGTYADKAADDGITYNTGTDWLHPDWWGHDQMAEAWLSVIESNFTPSGTFNASAAAAVDSSELGAAAKTELADYRKGFTRYGWFEATGAKDIEDITYNDIDASAATENIGRVGYFVEYVRADNNAHKWVWVDMDAFGTTIAELGLPAANHQQIVKHLHVKSNHNGIEDVAADDDSVSGWVEFSPNDYAGTVSGIRCSPSGNASVYDWNDALSEEANVDSGTNACMQVFRMAPGVPSGRGAQTLFAYNNWRSSTLGAEFGIGNFSSHYYGGANEAQTIDYTKTRSAVKMNAEAYTVKRIEIWTNPNNVGITTDGQGSNQNNSTYANSVNWSLNISQASPLTANDTKVKVDSISIGMRPDVSLAVMRLVVKDATSGDVLGTSELANGTGTTSGKAYANGAIRQEYKFAQDLLLDVGTTYTLEMVDSSGAKVGQGLRLETTTTAPIYNNHGDNTTYRITQDLCLSRVHVASVSADVASFGALTFSPALPTDYSDSALLVNVTADATLTLGAATTVGSIRFAVAEGVTLTIADPANINAGEVVFYGPGRVAFTGEPNFGAADVEFAGSPTIALATGQTLATTGSVVIDTNAALTLAPATITDPTATLVSATAFANNGTLGLTAPDEGSDYSIAATATGVTLRRVTREAFSYDAYPGGTGPTGWFESWEWDQFGNYYRVGPNSGIDLVYEVRNGQNPGSACTKSSSFSVAIYADVSLMASDGTRPVIFALGNGKNKNKFLAMYRQGDYVKLGNWSSSAFTDDWAAGVPVASGFHLYTATFDFDTGAISLYRDDGTASECVSTGIPAASFALPDSDSGFQIGNIWTGIPGTGNFAKGDGLAVAAVRGYDVALSATEVATLAESFPATDGSISWTVSPDAAGNTYTIASTTFASGTYLGISSGTLSIPSGSVVNTEHIRVLNMNDTGDVATVNVAGTLNITSTSSNPNVWAERNSNKGILFGHYHGTGTNNVTGTLSGPDAYLETVYTAETQTMNIDGGTVSVKGLYANNDNSTINLYNNGVLEVKEILSSGNAITKNFRLGTFRVLADATETRAINFSAASGNATTLDPYGHTLTLESAALTGTGYITVADSSAAGDGTVVFKGGSSFSGAVILTDANAGNIDIRQYTGKVVLRGTAAAIANLNGYTGIVIIDQAGTYDATSIDLSGATVQVADGCTYIATAGNEGTMVLDSGAAATLKVTNEIVNYEGHVPMVSGGGSVGYYNTETSAAVAGDDYINGNNLLPYYNVWTAGESDNTLATAARWKGGSQPAANKNVAFKLSADTTVTIDSTIAYNDIQVFGSGALTIQQTLDNVMTVGNGLYTMSGVSVQIDSGLAFDNDATLEIESAQPKYVGVNCGTAETPFEIPVIAGSGLLIIAEGKGLTTSSMSIGTATVQGALTLAGASTAAAMTVYSTGVVNARGNTMATTLTVNAGGVVNVESGATVSPATLTVNGTMNMASTATLSSVTTLSGAGTVTWSGKEPDMNVWNTSANWTGTNVVENLTANEQREIDSWGWTSSHIVLRNVKGWLANNTRFTAEVILENGAGEHGLEISDGSSNDNVTKFRRISGSGTLKGTGTGGVQRYIFETDSDFTGSIVKTDSVRLFVFSTNKDASAYPNRDTYKGYIYVDTDGVARIGDGKAWSVTTGGIVVNGAVELLGAASMTAASNSAITFGNGATLTFDDIGTSEAPKKLTLNSAVTVASADTVNIAFGDGVDTSDLVGTTLISWGGAPEGEFAFADSSLADNYYLVKTASGLEVAQWGVVTLTTDANVTSITGVTNGYKVKPGDTVSFTVATADGYDAVVTVGNEPLTANNGTYSYTVGGNVTITVTTVSTAVTFGAATFDYYATYASAKTVTAQVTGNVVSGTTFTLTAGGNNYTGTYENGIVTFSEVAVGGLGTTTSYTITATGGSTGTSASSATVGSTAASSGWMQWSESQTSVGGWQDETGTSVTPVYSEGAAAFSGTNTYTAAWTSTGEVVTVTTSVSFGSPADSELKVDADAQAAIRIGTENGANVFQVYAGPTSSWGSVYNDTLGAPEDDVTYALTLTLNYANQTFGVSVGGAGALTNAAGGAAFPLAKAASAMQQVSYLGAGSFISLSGQYVSAGYTADVGTDGSATNVVVSSDFVNTYLGDVLASNVSAALSPTNTTKQANGLNYFASYALGLDPTDEDDKPTIKVETNSEGKFVVTLTDKEGNVLDIADNVAVTLSVKTGATPESVTDDGVAGEIVDGEGSAEGKSFVIDPSKVDSVKYYKVRIDIGAK